MHMVIGTGMDQGTQGVFKIEHWVSSNSNISMTDCEVLHMQGIQSLKYEVES